MNDVLQGPSAAHSDAEAILGIASSRSKPLLMKNESMADKVNLHSCCLKILPYVTYEFCVSFIKFRHKNKGMFGETLVQINSCNACGKATCHSCYKRGDHTSTFRYQVWEGLQIVKDQHENLRRVLVIRLAAFAKR